MLNNFSSFFLLSLLLFMPINFSLLSNYSIVMNIIVYEDGWSEVNYVINNINLTFLDINIAKDAKFLLVLDSFGEPLDYELYDGKITVYCENITGIKVTYYTQSFTSKDSEGVWTFNLLTDANETNILLPKYSTILGFEEVPSKIRMENEMISLSFNSKKISFHYIIEIPIISKTKTTYTTTIQSSNGILTTYFKTETRIVTQTIFNKTTIITSLITYPFTETIKETVTKNETIFNLNLFYIILPIIITILIIIIFLLKKRKEAISYYLTEEENAIIDILKKRGGAYQSELVEILNLPKTTIWRHLKRLEKMGKIKIIKKENKNYIVLE